MKNTVLTLLTTIFFFTGNIQAKNPPLSQKDDLGKLMSEKYWVHWNADIQKKIDADIEANRKANALINIDAANGCEVKVEQISHEFIFGAHIFNFNQLGSKERNIKYKELYGKLFNSATIAFYWKEFETDPSRLRFTTEYWDTEDFWNNCPSPETQRNWRRPSTDQVVEFCESKGIRMHGHVLVWGAPRWHYPEWIIDKYATPEEKGWLSQYIVARANPQNFMNRDIFNGKFEKISPKEIAEKMPVFTEKTNALMEKRIREIAKHYNGRLHSWDICNESATDDSNGVIKEGDAITKSRYGLLPGDYTYKSFKLAEKYFPKEVKLNINDYFIDPAYAKQINKLVERDAKIDIVGYQMHIFNPQASNDIANGVEQQTPRQIYESFKILDQTKKPIHMSEITITSPGTEERDEEIQAIIASNLLRIWFSHKSVMGITWWNVVDGCGAPGEPSLSGIFTRDMKPKKVYYALDKLINEEWKTNTTLKVKDGKINFRGFKGAYKLSWKDKNGEIKNMDFVLKSEN